IVAIFLGRLSRCRVSSLWIMQREGTQMRGRSLLYCVLAAVVLVVAVLVISGVAPTPLRAKTLSPRESTTVSTGDGPSAAVPCAPPAPATSPPPSTTPAPPGAPVASGEAWPQPITGRVRDAERKPLLRASVVLNGMEYFTDAEGAFTIDVAPSTAPLLVK